MTLLTVNNKATKLLLVLISTCVSLSQSCPECADAFSNLYGKFEGNSTQSTTKEFYSVLIIYSSQGATEHFNGTTFECGFRNPVLLTNATKGLLVWKADYDYGPCMRGGFVTLEADRGNFWNYTWSLDGRVEKAVMSFTPECSCPEDSGTEIAGPTQMPVTQTDGPTRMPVAQTDGPTRIPRASSNDNTDSIVGGIVAASVVIMMMICFLIPRFRKKMLSTLCSTPTTRNDLSAVEDGIQVVTTMNEPSQTRQQTRTLLKIPGSTKEEAATEEDVGILSVPGKLKHTTVSQCETMECASPLSHGGRFDIFLSHAGYDDEQGPGDKGFVAPLHTDLLACAEEEERKLNIFFDRDSIPIGDRSGISATIVMAAATTRIVVFVLTDAFVRRDWTLLELEIALARGRKGRTFRGNTTFQNFLEDKFSAESLTHLLEHGDFEPKDGKPAIIVPLFFRFSPSDCRDESKFAHIDDEHTRNRWKTAMDQLSKIGGEEYDSRSQDYITYARKVASRLVTEGGIYSGQSIAEAYP